MSSHHCKKSFHRRLWTEEQVIWAIQSTIKGDFDDIFPLLEQAITEGNDRICSVALAESASKGNLFITEHILHKREIWSNGVLSKALYQSLVSKHFDISHVLLKHASDWDENVLSKQVDEEVTKRITSDSIINLAVRSRQVDLFIKLMEICSSWSIKTLSKVLVDTVNEKNKAAFYHVLNKCHRQSEWTQKDLEKPLLKAIDKELYDVFETLLPYIKVWNMNLLRSALETAALRGNIALCKFIISKADRIEKFYHGSAMRSAAENEHFDLVVFLLSQSDGWTQRDVDSTLVALINAGKVELFDLVMSKVEVFDSDTIIRVCYLECFEQSILEAALLSKELHFYETLIKRVSSWDVDSLRSALNQIVKFGKDDTINHLLPSIHKLDPEDVSDVMATDAEKGRASLCKVLLNSLSSSTWAAGALQHTLEIAITKIENDIALALLHAASDWSELTLSDALSIAAEHSKIEVMEAILDLIPTWSPSNLQTSVRKMTDHGNIQFVSTLLKKTDSWKAVHLRTSVLASIVDGNTKLFKLLLDSANDWGGKDIRYIFKLSISRSPPDKLPFMCKYLLQKTTEPLCAEALSIPLYRVCKDGHHESCKVILDACTDWDETTLVLAFMRSIKLNNGAVAIEILTHYRTAVVCRDILKQMTHQQVTPKLFSDVTQAIAAYYKQDKENQALFRLATSLMKCVNNQYFFYCFEKEKSEVASFEGDPHCHDVHGHTPLMLAAWFKLPGLVEDILLKGADIHAQENNEKSPIHYACSLPYHPKFDINGQWHPNTERIPIEKLKLEETLEVLIRNGGLVNCKDRFGNTPLHICVFEGNAKACKFLKMYKPDLMIRNKANKTALMHAYEHNMFDIIEALGNTDHGSRLLEMEVPSSQCKYMSPCCSLLLRYRPALCQYKGDIYPLPDREDLIKALATHPIFGPLQNSDNIQNGLIVLQCFQFVKCLRKRIAQSFPLFEGGFEISGSIMEGTKTAPFNELDVLILLPELCKYMEYQGRQMIWDEAKMRSEHPYIILGKDLSSFKAQDANFWVNIEPRESIHIDVYELLQTTIIEILMDADFWVECNVPSLQWMQHLKDTCRTATIAEPLLLQWHGPEGIVYISMDLVPVLTMIVNPTPMLRNMAVLRPKRDSGMYGQARWKQTHYRLERNTMAKLPKECKLAYMIAKILVNICPNSPHKAQEINSATSFNDLHQHLSARLAKVSEKMPEVELINNKAGDSVGKLISSYVLKNALFHWLDPYASAYLRKQVRGMSVGITSIYEDAPANHPFKLLENIQDPLTLFEANTFLLPIKDLIESDQIFDEEFFRSFLLQNMESKFDHQHHQDTLDSLLESKGDECVHTHMNKRTDKLYASYDWVMVYETVKGIFQTIDKFVKGDKCMPCFLPSSEPLFLYNNEKTADVTSILGILK